jgi:hypothetical protein
MPQESKSTIFLHGYVMRVFVDVRSGHTPKALGVRVANELNLLEKSANRSRWWHTSLIGSVDWSDRSHLNPTRNLQTFAQEGSCQGEHVLICPSVGRPARTPSIVVEIK